MAGISRRTGTALLLAALLAACAPEQAQPPAGSTAPVAGSPSETTAPPTSNGPSSSTPPSASTPASAPSARPSSSATASTWLRISLSTTSAEGSALVVLRVAIDGRVQQLWLPVERTYLDPAYSSLLGYRVDWGDGSEDSGFEAGQVGCRAGGRLVPVHELYVADAASPGVEMRTTAHRYQHAGTYTVTFTTAACRPGVTVPQTASAWDAADRYSQRIEVRVDPVGG